MSDLFIYDFTFRGGPTSSPDDDTWHVVLAREVIAIDGSKKLECTDTMTPTQAAEMGYPLTRIMSMLNHDFVVAADDARKERDAALAQLETASSDVVQAEPETDKKSLMSRLSFGLLK